MNRERTKDDPIREWPENRRQALIRCLESGQDSCEMVSRLGSTADDHDNAATACRYLARIIESIKLISSEPKRPPELWACWNGERFMRSNNGSTSGLAIFDTEMLAKCAANKAACGWRAVRFDTLPILYKDVPF